MVKVVDKPLVRQPGELDDFPIKDRDSLAEKFRRQISFLDDLAGFEAHFSDGRVAAEACTFIDEALFIRQPLRKSGGIMRKDVYPLVGVFGSCI